MRKIPWRRAWQPNPVFLPGEFHGQRSLVSYSPQGLKESDTTERLTHTYKVGLKSTRNQFNIIKIYTVFTQYQGTNSIQVPMGYKLGDTGIYPGT